MVEVRQIRHDDAEMLRSVRLAALASDPAAFASTHRQEEQRPAGHWARLAQERAAGDAGTNFFAVDETGRPVGLIGVFRDGPDRLAVITSMWVAPEARGQGIGAQLVEAAVSWADSAGATAVELWVTRGNRAAHRLYEKLGFVDTHDLKPLPSDPCRLEQRMRLTQSGVT